MVAAFDEQAAIVAAYGQRADVGIAGEQAVECLAEGDIIFALDEDDGLRGNRFGQPFAQLLDDQRCAIFGQPERPAFCAGLRASPEMCGSSREAALHWLNELERQTSPSSVASGIQHS